MAIIPGDPPQIFDPFDTKWLSTYSEDATGRPRLRIEVAPGDGTAGLRTVIADDVDVTIDDFNGTTVVIFVGLTVGHSVFLPPASGPSQIVVMKDQTGLASGAHALAFVPRDGDQILDSTDIVRGSDTHHGVSSITNDGVGAWGSVLDTSALLSDLIAQLGGAGNDVIQRRIIANDVDVTVDAFNGTTVVLYTALTAPRAVTLPPASGPSQIVIVKDVDGLATAENTITFVPADGDSVNGAGAIGQNHSDFESGTLHYANDTATRWIEINDLSAELNRVLGDPGSIKGISVVRKFPFAFDTPNLLTGAALYTPTPGDILLDAWIEIDTAWDGTNAKLDLGAFDDDKYGWYAFASNPIPLDSPDHVLSGALVGNNPLATSLSQQAVAGSSRIAPNKLTGAPIKVCVSRDGTNTGDDPASTQGAAVLYLVTATPVGP